MRDTIVPSIDPKEQIDFMNIDETDFSAMSRPEQIRHLEVEGYVVFPEILPPNLITKIKDEMADAEMGHTILEPERRAGKRPSGGIHRTGPSTAM